MIDKVERKIYGKHWFFAHAIISIFSIFIIGLFIKLCDLEFNRLLFLINDNTVSISATIAGFVFTGVSIFISMEGSKKMNVIKSIDKDNVIYHILICSIVFFTLSLLLMIIRINLLDISSEVITKIQNIVKSIIEWSSLYALLLGFIYFISSLKLISWIFK